MSTAVDNRFYREKAAARDDGGPAFPIPGLQADASFNGMTLRDHFAGLAMQALIAATHATADDTPTLAYEIADAMLEARKA